MNVKISPRSILIFFLSLFLIAMIGWLGFERIGLYFAIYSPLPKEWSAVHMMNGDVYYGHISGIGSGVIRLRDAYFLDKVHKDNDQSGLEAGSASNSFSVGAAVEQNQRYILVQQPKEVFLNRQAVLFWQDVSPSEEVSRFLK